jgi:hypothetical protein
MKSYEKILVALFGILCLAFLVSLPQRKEAAKKIPYNTYPIGTGVIK